VDAFETWYVPPSEFPFFDSRTLGEYWKAEIGFCPGGIQDGMKERCAAGSPKRDLWVLTQPSSIGELKEEGWKVTCLSIWEKRGNRVLTVEKKFQFETEGRLKVKYKGTLHVEKRGKRTTVLLILMQTSVRTERRWWEESPSIKPAKRRKGKL